MSRWGESSLTPLMLALSIFPLYIYLYDEANKYGKIITQITPQFPNGDASEFIIIHP